MLRSIEGVPNSITTIDALGKVTSSDYQSFMKPILENSHKTGEKMKILYRFGPEFSELTPGAAWEDLKVGLRYLRLFQRCAIVSDVEWLRKSTVFFSALIPCPVKIFTNAEMEQAVDWLSAHQSKTNLGIEFRADRGVIVLEPKGQLQKEDFDELALLVDPYIEAHGMINGIVIHAKQFPGWDDFGSFVRHFSFVKEHHKKISKIAVVTDSVVMELIPKMAEHFVHAKIKEFPFDRKEAAIEWASKA